MISTKQAKKTIRKKIIGRYVSDIKSLDLLTDIESKSILMFQKVVDIVKPNYSIMLV